uniref:Protein kinase domain-containing protein n=1 Tax=Chromera velia CCMP2878 TaxID=1169474 RepID=A0A0G4ICY6_9ALVE|eukprot:Cvel_2325.t1-p1 / transcript=Cvel_2325.t1 / gene=Cvel_2325 / organism=Chromera_velia_CCMP2878 / gene_product=Probable inactive protein kinase At3g63330, putative / transcript_product=Probable inactive protein kinase At3g63330, putative / location=Cvel_scaffold89:130787-138888(+) / protein_length=1139 / sequence_SO=supercontig / SO=protein_coding / is_pseudo=false
MMASKSPKLGSTSPSHLTGEGGRQSLLDKIKKPILSVAGSRVSPTAKDGLALSPTGRSRDGVIRQGGGLLPDWQPPLSSDDLTISFPLQKNLHPHHIQTDSESHEPTMPMPNSLPHNETLSPASLTSPTFPVFSSSSLSITNTNRLDARGGPPPVGATREHRASLPWWKAGGDGPSTSVGTSGVPDLTPSHVGSLPFPPRQIQMNAGASPLATSPASREDPKPPALNATAAPNSLPRPRAAPEDPRKPKTHQPWIRESASERRLSDALMGGGLRAPVRGTVGVSHSAAVSPLLSSQPDTPSGEQHIQIQSEDRGPGTSMQCAGVHKGTHVKSPTHQRGPERHMINLGGGRVQRSSLGGTAGVHRVGGTTPGVPNHLNLALPLSRTVAGVPSATARRHAIHLNRAIASVTEAAAASASGVSLEVGCAYINKEGGNNPVSMRTAETGVAVGGSRASLTHRPSAGGTAHAAESHRPPSMTVSGRAQEANNTGGRRRRPPAETSSTSGAYRVPMTPSSDCARGEDLHRGTRASRTGGGRVTRAGTVTQTAEERGTPGPSSASGPRHTVQGDFLRCGAGSRRGPRASVGGSLRSRCETAHSIRDERERDREGPPRGSFSRMPRPSQTGRPGGAAEGSGRGMTGGTRVSSREGSGGGSANANVSSSSSSVTLGGKGREREREKDRGSGVGGGERNGGGRERKSLMGTRVGVGGGESHRTSLGGIGAAISPVRSRLSDGPSDTGRAYQTAAGAAAAAEAQASVAEASLLSAVLTPKEEAEYGGRFLEGYERVRCLGKGGCAVVWLARSRGTREPVAIKQVLKGSTAKASADVESARREISVGQFLFHNGEPRKALESEFRGIRHVARMIDSRETARDLWIVFEMAGVSLTKLLFNIKGEFWNGQRTYRVVHGRLLEVFKRNLRSLKSFLRKMMEALHLLSTHGLVHSDLKPDNILVKNQQQQQQLHHQADGGGDEEDIKLIDFGSCYRFDSPEGIGMATPEYMPPEALEVLSLSVGGGRGASRDEIHQRVCGESVPWALDVWAVGALLLEMSMGVPLWLAYNCRVTDRSGKSQIATGLFSSPQRDNRKIVAKQREIVKKLRKTIQGGAGVPLHTDPDGLDFLFLLLQLDPRDRISPAEALAHPFLQ